MARHSLLTLITAPAILAAVAAAKDWHSPYELAYELKIYQNIAAALLGIHFWEHLISLRFEWEVYSRKIRWRHGMIAYLLIRLATWATLIPLLLNINATKKNISCEASLIALLIPFSVVVVTTSLIFVVRCIAVWERNRYVTAVVLGLWLTEAALHFSSAARIHSSFVGGSCATYFIRPMWEYNLANLFVLLTDLVSFVLMVYRLRHLLSTARIGRLLFQQSVIYVGTVSALNVASMVLFYRALTPLLGYIGSPIAMVISGILGCRAFRDLQYSALKPASTVHHQTQFSNHWIDGLSTADDQTRDKSEQPQQAAAAAAAVPNPPGNVAHGILGATLTPKENWCAKMGLEEGWPTVDRESDPTPDPFRSSPRQDLPSGAVGASNNEASTSESSRRRLDSAGSYNREQRGGAATSAAFSLTGENTHDPPEAPPETSNIPRGYIRRPWWPRLYGGDIESASKSQTDTTKADHGHSRVSIRGRTVAISREAAGV